MVESVLGTDHIIGNSPYKLPHRINAMFMKRYIISISSFEPYLRIIVAIQYLLQ